MPKSIWILVIGMAINLTGASFLWPLNTIYISQELGQSLTVAGIILMFNGAAGIVGNLLGGRLFDRIGGYPTIMIGVTIAMASAFLLAFLHTSFIAYVLLLVFIGFGSGLLMPCMYAMAGALWPEGGRKPYNAMYVSQNAGVAAGSAIGGLMASYRFDFVFFGNGLMYFIFFLLAFFYFRRLIIVEDDAIVTDVFEERSFAENKNRIQALFILCSGFLLCWVGYSQWSSTISVHTQSLGIPLHQYSILWTINGAMIVFFQPVMKFFIQRCFHSLRSQIYVGLAIFIMSFMILSQAENLTFFVVAMVTLTLGEMFVWPAIPTIASRLAPKGRAGYYQGIVNSIAAGGRLIGPVFGGVLADLYGMTVLFYAVAILFIIPLITTAIYDRKLENLDIDEEKN